MGKARQCMKRSVISGSIGKSLVSYWSIIMPMSELVSNETASGNRLSDRHSLLVGETIFSQETHESVSQTRVGRFVNPDSVR